MIKQSKKIKLLYLFISAVFFLLPLVSSNGLVVSNNTFSINKVVNQDYYVNLTIRNTEPFTFYNISLDDNSKITFTKIPQLLSGEERNVTLRVFSNEDINLKLKVKGFYEAKIGDSNKTYNIISSWADGVNPCIFSIIKGETVIWRNIENFTTRKMYLYNSETNSKITDILPQNNFTMTFSSPQTLNFHILRYGIDLTPSQYCQLSVLNDVGLINNPSLDAVLNVNIKNTYDPTTLVATFFNYNYTLNFNSQQDGFFVLQNTGSKIAKNILISGDWFSFSSPGRNMASFDLSPGEVANVLYVLKPRIYNTTDTNKTYNKNILIEGNFNTIRQNISVFVNYAEINTLPNSSTQEDLISFITLFCSQNPTICNTEARIIYRDLNNSENYFNASLGERQLKELFLTLLNFIETQQQLDNFNKEQFTNLSSKLTSVEASTITTQDDISKVKTKIDTSNGVWIFLGFFMFALFICGTLLYIGIILKKKNKLDVLGRY